VYHFSPVCDLSLSRVDEGAKGGNTLVSGFRVSPRFAQRGSGVLADPEQILWSANSSSLTEGKNRPKFAVHSSAPCAKDTSPVR